MGRVLAQAGVGNHDQVGHGGFDGGGGLLDNAAVMPCARGIVIFIGRNAKQNDRRNAQIVDLLGFFDDLVDRKLKHPWHRLNFLSDRVARNRKQGVDQIAGGENRFAHHPTQLGVATQATRAVEWKHRASQTWM